MGEKADERICRYAKCLHESRLIDTTKDEYRVCGKMYYHSDCYELKERNDREDERKKKDLQYIKNQWVLHIDRSIVYSQLYRSLNALLARGFSSDYLVFALDYVIKNKMNLRYAEGFKYFVAKKEIQEAYRRYLAAEGGLSKDSFSSIKDDDTLSPKFTFVQEPQGFGIILGGKK